jgi:hypothetical protein
MTIVALPARRARRPVWRRWAFWFVAAVAGCGALLAVRTYFSYRHAADALKAAVDDLDRTDPGWRLGEIEAARADVPAGENAAACVEAADGALPEEWGVSRFHQRLFSLGPDESLDAGRRLRLEMEVWQNQGALDEAVKLADLTRGRYTVVWKPNVLGTPLPHLAKVRRVTAFLCFDALARTEEGDAQGALRSCRAALNAGRSVGDEPLSHSQLTRAGCVQSACRAVARVLARCAADADDLAAVQRLLEEEDRFPRLLVLTRGERAVLHQTLAAVESGTATAADLALLPESSSRGPSAPFRSVDAVRAAHPRILRAATEAVAITRLPAHQRPERIAAFQSGLTDDGPFGVTAGFHNNLRRLDETARHTDAHLRCTITAVAVERYRLRHGTWPAELTDLTPDLLTDVPQDPTTGRPLGYVHLPWDGVLIFTAPAPQITVKTDWTIELAPDPKEDGAFVRLHDAPKRR